MIILINNIFIKFNTQSQSPIPNPQSRSTVLLQDNVFITFGFEEFDVFFIKSKHFFIMQSLQQTQLLLTKPNNKKMLLSKMLLKYQKSQILLLENFMSTSSQVLKYFLFFSYYLHGLQPFQLKSKKMNTPCPNLPYTLLNFFINMKD